MWLTWMRVILSWGDHGIMMLTLREHLYVQLEGQKIVIRSIPPISKELNETNERSALLIKEEVNPSTEVSEKVKLLLEEFKGVIHSELPERLLHMRGIQYQ